jgi:predicted dinucleotide-binding enzyme
MRVGTVGAGRFGATAAKVLVNAGHEVALSNSRGPASLSALVTELGARANAMTVADAARWDEVPASSPFYRQPAFRETGLRLQ